MSTKQKRVAILYPENRTVGRKSSVESDLFSKLFQGFGDMGIVSQPVAYHDDCCHDVEIKLLQIGTKEVLYRTREVGWGRDTHLYLTLEQMCQELPRRLASGETRVLKQYRGNGGIGVWRVQWLGNQQPEHGRRSDFAELNFDTPVSVRQAIRGAYEEMMPLGALFDLCRPYFVNEGRVIDQVYQERLTEGMIRCYLVHNQVVGFGHQAVNALFPAPAGALPSTAPQPGPRLYYPPTKNEFELLKHKLEQEWLPAAQELLRLDAWQLPIIWDCDFLLGPRDELGADTYVLCEINASCVSPFPAEAIPFIVASTAARMKS